MTNFLRISLALFCVMAINSAVRAQRVLAYYPYWITGQETAVQYDKLTDIVYAFLQLDGSGNLASGNYFNTTQFAQIRDLAHAQNVNVHASVGGGGQPTNDLAWVSQNAGNRANMVAELVDFVSGNHALNNVRIKGIDVDWEFPTDQAKRDDHEDLLRELRTALDAQGAIDGVHYELSIAIGGDVLSPTSHADYYNSACFQYPDLISIMSYDLSYMTQYSGHHASYQAAVDGVNGYSAIGVDPAKVMIGVPFYGRTSGGWAADYKVINASGTTTLQQNDFDGQYYYNGTDLIEQKIDYVMQTVGGQGVTIWELTQDRNDQFSLLTHTFDYMQNYACATPQPDLGSDQSICGVSSINLTSGVTTAGGRTFSWKRNGTTINGANSPNYSANQSGTYEITVTESGCSKIDQVEIVGTLPDPSLGADVDLCSPSSVTLDASVSGAGINYAWTRGGQSIAGANSQTLFVNESGNYEVTISASSCGQKTDNIVVTSSLPTVTGDTICSAGIASLSCSESVDWYTVAVDGTPFATGQTSVSPSISSTTTYYVEATGGSTDYTVGGTSLPNWTASSQVYAHKFEVFTDITLNSVGIDAAGAGQVNVRIVENDETTIVGETGLQAVNAGPQTFPVGIDLTPGVYYMNTLTSTVNLRISTDNTSGPYTEAGVISIETAAWEDWSGNGYSVSTNYGNMIDWDVTAGSACDRVAVVAVIDGNHSSCSSCSTPTSVSISPGSQSVCAPVSELLTATSVPSSGFEYEFYLDGVSVQGPSVSTYTATAEGDYYVIARDPSDPLVCFLQSSTVTISETSAVSNAGAISGTSLVCAGSSQSYSISSVAGATSYLWTYNGVTLPETGTSVSFTTGFVDADLEVTPQSACGDGLSSTLTIEIQALPTGGTIAGGQAVCEADVVTYSLSRMNDASSIAWQVPEGSSIQSQSGNTVDVIFGDASGDVVVTGSNTCGAGTPIAWPITVTPLADAIGAINGSSQVCENATGEVYNISPVAGAIGYTWTVPSGASIVSGQGSLSLVVDFGSVAGDIEVSASASCGDPGSSTLSVGIDNVPATPGAISGNLTACGNISENYSISAVAAATSYSWSVESGMSITNGQGTIGIDVDVNAISGNVEVIAENSCGSSNAAILAITGESQPSTSVITGDANPICFASGQTYSVTATVGHSYNWSVPSGASIVSAQGQSGIVVDFGSSNGNVSVIESTANSCEGAEVSMAISLTGCVGLDAEFSTSNNVVCPNEDMTFTDLTTGTVTTYSWDFGNGAVPSTSNLQNPGVVNWTSPGVKTVSLTVTGPAGTDTETKTGFITVVDPALNLSGVSGNATVCENASAQTYSITQVAGASYLWSVPSGASVVSGQGTEAILVDFGVSGGDVSVEVTGTCGFENASLTVGTQDCTDPIPDFSADVVQVCSGSTVTFTDLTQGAATGHSWDFGPGANPATATGVGPHMVTYSSSGLKSVELTVDGVINQISETKNDFIEVEEAPVGSGVIVGSTAVCASATGVAYDLSGITGADSYSWMVPAGATVVSGASTTSIVVDFGATGGDLTVDASNNCGDNQTQLSVAVQDVPSGLGVIAGASSFCASTLSSYVVSGISDVDDYVWSTTGGLTLTGGQGSANVDVTIAGSDGSLSVIGTNSCGSSVETQILIGLDEVPQGTAVISGDLNVCENTMHDYIVSGVTNASNYTWIIDDGSIVSGQGTSVGSVSISALSTTLSVEPSNACGASTTAQYSLVTSSIPATPSITGVSSACENDVVSYSTTATSNLAWTYSGSGVSFSGNSSTTSASFGVGATSGNVGVTTSNQCGTSAMGVFGVTVNSVPDQPGTFLLNSAVVTQGDQSVAYSVPAVNGVTYAWSYAGLGSAINGSGASVTIDYGESATSGILLVSASNSCGSGLAREMNVTVNLVQNVDPTIVVSSPINGSSVMEGSSVNLSSSTSDSDGSVVAVVYTIRLGSSVVATINGVGATWANAWVASSLGNYSITAVATDDKGGTGQDIVNITVLSSSVNIPPSISLTSPEATGDYEVASEISLSVNAIDVDGSVTEVEYFITDNINGGTVKVVGIAPSFSALWTPNESSEYNVVAVATDDDGAQSFSSNITITVDPVGIEDELTEVFAWDVYPNPSEGDISVDVTLKEAGPVKITVFDVTGTNVLGIVDEDLSKGAYSFEIRQSELPSGVYMVHLSHAGQNEWRRLVKQN